MQFHRNQIANIERENNKIKIRRMDHPSCVSDFLRAIYNGIQRGYSDFIITFEVNAVFPNACVPMAGIIDYYSRKGINISYHINNGDYLKKCSFENPLELHTDEIKALASPFDRLFKYSESSQVSTLTQTFIDTLGRIAQCNKGVIDGIVWCVNEVMDNVLVHSETEYGYVMSQFHPNTNHIAFCIFDSGIGIYNSLRNSKHHPHSPLDAISLSMQEGIGDGKGQGNGLYGLQRIVEFNGGRLTITTGSASLMLLKSGERKTFENLPFLDSQSNGTTVDFQLDISKEIDIQTVFQSIGGFDCFDRRIDNMLLDNDYLQYDVFENCEGTATREAGLHVRNDVFNILQRSSSPIILDFSRVSSVSSSFIDEFVSKLVIQLGIFGFNQFIKIQGMSNTIKYLFERSTYMRIHSMWNDREKDIDSFDSLLDA